MKKTTHRSLRGRLAAAAIAGLMAITAAPVGSFGGFNVTASAEKLELTVGNFTLTADTSTQKATIKKYTGTESNVVITNLMSSGGIYYEITAIEDAAFENNTYITNVYLPSSIVSIGNGAFSGCTSLSDITIPNSVKTIGAYAFAGCTSLTSIYPFTYPFPNSHAMTSLDLTAFSNCSSLTCISLPKCVTKISSTDFVGCTALNTLYIPTETVSIDDSPSAQYRKVSLICGYNGSEAWRFATTNNIIFKDLNPSPTPTPVTISSPVISAKYVEGSGVVITWNAVLDAAGYYIYRSGNRNPIGDTSKLTFTDTNVTRGYTYSYTVAAYNGSAISEDSNQVNVSIPQQTSIDTVNVYGKVSGFGEVYSGEVIYIELIDSDGYTMYTETNDGNYTIYGVEKYEKYTMKVKMPGCPDRSYTITASTSDIIQNATLRRYGDADGDGKITATDATQILKYDAGMQSKLSSADGYTLKAVSLFGDTQPSAKDATQIIRYLSYYSLPSRLDNLVSPYMPRS